MVLLETLRLAFTIDRTTSFNHSRLVVDVYDLFCLRCLMFELWRLMFELYN